MTIQQLARRAGVTPRTIRYYVEQGLLPPPGRGRPAEYGEEHVQRLELIRRLKAQYLPLEEIRDTLRRLTVEQVEELLTSDEPPRTQSETRDSASEYIAHVLGRGAVREQMKTQAMPAAPAQAPMPPPAPVAAPMPPAAPMASPSRAAFRASPPAEDEAVRFRLAESAAPAQEAEVEEASTWQRVALAPGVELHYMAGADARTQHFVARLIEAARRILGAIPGN